MLAGLWPTLLLAGAPPIYNAYVTPNPGSWFGEVMNYTTELSVEHSGGTAPFTYSWTADSAVITSSPTARSISLASNNGAPAFISCTITDALGAGGVVSGMILGVAGGGGGVG